MDLIVQGFQAVVTTRTIGYPAFIAEVFVIRIGLEQILETLAVRNLRLG